MELEGETTLRDLGNGLIIVGATLLVTYLALLLLAFSLYAGESWKVWTYPSLFGLATGVILVLFLASALLRHLPPSRPREETTAEERLDP